MKGVHFLSLSAAFILAMASSVASAYDPSPLQDFCVATDIKFLRAGYVNGDFCKNPKYATVNDFSSSGFNTPGEIDISVGSSVTIADVKTFPGLNTMGISFARIDYAPNGGQNPPHLHPRGSELLAVAVGTLSVGFISSSQDNMRLFNKTLNQGDIFVFPIGMIHFEVNIGSTPAVAFTVINSQNPGVITVADSVFGSQPSINPDFLAKAFNLDRSVVINLQKLFGSKKY